MIDRIRYYAIVWGSMVNAIFCYPDSYWYNWYNDTDSLKTDCVPYLMCHIAYDMLYEMGV